MSSSFGPLHIPFKKWAAAANLPHAHQFDQDMQRIEDWAQRLHSGGGVGGGVTPVMDGRRFTVALSGMDIAEGMASGPKLEIGKMAGSGHNYSTFLTGQFDLEISAAAGGTGAADAKYLVECWVQPTDWPQIVAPIARQHFRWGDGGKVTVHFEWMMDWFWNQLPEYAEAFYGFTPPTNINPVTLAPEIRVTWLDPPPGERQLNVTGDVVLHAISLGNTYPGESPEELRPDLDQLEVVQGTPIRAPASTVAFAPPAVKGWVFESTWSNIYTGTWPFWTDPSWDSHPTGLTTRLDGDLSFKSPPMQTEVSSDGPEVTLNGGEVVFNVSGDYRITATYTFTAQVAGSGTAVQTVGLAGVWGSVVNIDGFGEHGYDTFTETISSDTSPILTVAGETSAPIAVSGAWDQLSPETTFRYCLTHLRLQIEKVS